MTVSMTDASPKVEVISSVQRRRKWSAAEKVRMVEETYAPGALVSLGARRHGMSPRQLFSWHRMAAEGASTAATAGEELVPASEHRALRQQAEAEGWPPPNQERARRVMKVYGLLLARRAGGAERHTP